MTKEQEDGDELESVVNKNGIDPENNEKSAFVLRQDSDSLIQ